LQTGNALPLDLCDKHGYVRPECCDPSDPKLRAAVFDIASQGHAHFARGLELLGKSGRKGDLETVLRPQMIRSNLYYRRLESVNFDAFDDSLIDSPLLSLQYQYQLLRSKLSGRI
jgi:hypothetical protein